jgi:DNA-binding MarR family transcriptional regulator
VTGRGYHPPDMSRREPRDEHSSPLDDISVSRLRLGLLRVARRIRQDADTGLTPSQQSTIVQLDRFGPMNLGELARRESVRPPSLTRTIQALEAAGMVSREGEEGSRRVRVDLTDAGRLAALEIHARRDAWLTERMAALSEDELEILRSAAPVLERLLDE